LKRVAQRWHPNPKNRQAYPRFFFFSFSNLSFNQWGRNDPKTDVIEPADGIGGR
jgi:hypothetical protein